MNMVRLDVFSASELGYLFFLRHNLLSDILQTRVIHVCATIQLRDCYNLQIYRNWLTRFPIASMTYDRASGADLLVTGRRQKIYTPQQG